MRFPKLVTGPRSTIQFCYNTFVRNYLFSSQNYKSLHLTVINNKSRCLYPHHDDKDATTYNMPKLKEGKTKKGSGNTQSAVGATPSENSAVTVHSDGSILIKILAKPGAKQNSVTGLTEEGVGVQISAPPVEGEANTELVKYISKVLNLRKSDIQLDKGSKSRNKILRVDKTSGLTVQAVLDKLKQEIQS